MALPNVRAGTTQTGFVINSFTGVTPVPFDTTQTLTVTIEGGDCKAVNVNVTAASVTFDVEANKDAIPGWRDVRLQYATANAVPVFKRRMVHVVRRGCLGSRMYCWVVDANPGGLNPPGSPTEDFGSGPVFIDELALDKRWTMLGASPHNAPRIYLWDIGYENNQMKVVGSASEQPKLMNTGGPPVPANAWDPDRHNRDYNIESIQPQRYLGGAGTQDQSKYWLAPSPVNPWPYQWTQQGNGAVGLAPDELVQTSALVVNESRWRGFPVPVFPFTAIGDHPKNTFWRKSWHYLGTGDWFWSNAKLGDASAATPSVAEFWIINRGASNFIGIPLWERGTGVGFNAAEYDQPFKLLREYEWANDLYYAPKNTTTGTPPVQSPAKAILTISIEAVDLLLPGPQTKSPTSTAHPYRQQHTYRRARYDNEGALAQGNSRKGTSTRFSRIKVQYQDLYAWQDEYGPGGHVSGAHEMSEPIVIAEAYVPRIDMTIDYQGWADAVPPQPIPQDAQDPDGSNRPVVSFESEPFEWRQVLTDPEQVTVGNSVSPGVPDGKFILREKAAAAAELFMAEFEGYDCKLVLDRSWYGSDPNDNWFAPATRPYAQTMTDREGTWLAVRAHIEVVEKEGYNP